MIYVIIFRKYLKTNPGKVHIDTFFVMKYFDDIKSIFQRIIDGRNGQIMKFLGKRRTQE